MPFTPAFASEMAVSVPIMPIVPPPYSRMSHQPFQWEHKLCSWRNLTPVIRAMPSRVVFKLMVSSITVSECTKLWALLRDDEEGAWGNDFLGLC